jgi:heptosyltransferase-3
MNDFFSISKTNSMNNKKGLVAVIPGTGLGDSLLHLPIVWQLLKEGYQVRFFSSSITSLIKPLENLEIWPSCNYLTSLDYLITHLHGCSTIFVQQSSPAVILLKTTFPIHILGTSRFDHLSQAQQISAKVCHLLKLMAPDIQELRSNFLNFDLVSSKAESLVVIHPGSQSRSKNWPLEKFIFLAEFLKKKGWQVVFCLGPDDLAFHDQIPIYFKKWCNLNLKELSKRLLRSKLFVGNDSGIGHLASLLGVPTLSLFASRNHAKLWRPEWSSHFIITPLIPLPGKLRVQLWKKCLFCFQVYIKVKKILTPSSSL